MKGREERRKRRKGREEEEWKENRGGTRELERVGEKEEGTGRGKVERNGRSCAQPRTPPRCGLL